MPPNIGAKEPPPSRLPRLKVVPAAEATGGTESRKTAPTAKKSPLGAQPPKGSPKPLSVPPQALRQLKAKKVAEPPVSGLRNNKPVVGYARAGVSASGPGVAELTTPRASEFFASPPAVTQSANRGGYAASSTGKSEKAPSGYARASPPTVPESGGGYVSPRGLAPAQSVYPEKSLANQYLPTEQVQLTSFGVPPMNIGGTTNATFQSAGAAFQTPAVGYNHANEVGPYMQQSMYGNNAAAEVGFASSPQQVPGALYSNLPNFTGLHSFPQSTLQPRVEHSVPVHLSKEDRAHPAFKALQEENIKLRVEVTKMRNEVAAIQQRERLASEMQIQRLEQNAAWEKNQHQESMHHLQEKLEESERKALRAMAGLKLMHTQVQERQDEVKRIKDWIGKVVRKTEEARFGEERFQRVMDVFQSAATLNRELDGTLQRLNNLELHTDVEGMTLGEMEGELALENLISNQGGMPALNFQGPIHSDGSSEYQGPRHESARPSIGQQAPPAVRPGPKTDRPRNNLPRRQRRTTNFVEMPTNKDPTPRDIVAAKRAQANQFGRFK